MVPWVFSLRRLASFLASLANSFPAGLQGSDSSIKIAVFLPNCRKRSNAVFNLPDHLDHLFSEVAPLGRLAGRFCSPRPAARLCPIWTTDFFQSRFLTSQYSPAPLVPVSLCPPFPIFSLLSSLSCFLPQRSASFVFWFLDGSTV